jgi:predicted cupin superfamily sugar epimerase
LLLPEDNLRMFDEGATMPSAAEVIRLLDLKPHPEGGHFRETFRDLRKVDGARAASTAAYFLLARGERSHWHKVDAPKPGFTTRGRRSSSRSRQTRRGRSRA